MVILSFQDGGATIPDLPFPDLREKRRERLGLGVESVGQARTVFCTVDSIESGASFIRTHQASWTLSEPFLSFTRPSGKTW